MIVRPDVKKCIYRSDISRKEVIIRCTKIDHSHLTHSYLNKCKVNPYIQHIMFDFRKLTGAHEFLNNHISLDQAPIEENSKAICILFHKINVFNKL